MKRYWIILAIVIGILIITTSMVLATATQQADGSDSQPAGSVAAQQITGSDSQPTGQPEVVIPRQYQPRNTDFVQGSTDVTDVYFTPQDENTSTTVLFLYNTNGVTATVALQTFRLDGSMLISTSIDVPPGNLVRVVGDAVSTVASTWQDTVLVNFTTFSTYAKLSVPDGVKAEAYVAWNGGSTFDPLDAVPTLNIRFSTDPESLFIPTLNKD